MIEGLRWRSQWRGWRQRHAYMIAYSHYNKSAMLSWVARMSKFQLDRIDGFPAANLQVACCLSRLGKSTFQVGLGAQVVLACFGTFAVAIVCQVRCWDDLMCLIFFPVSNKFLQIECLSKTLIVHSLTQWLIYWAGVFIHDWFIVAKWMVFCF